VIIAIIAVLVVGGGVTGIVLATTGGKKHSDAHKSPSPTVSLPATGGSSGGFPSSDLPSSGFPSSGFPSSGGGSGAPSEADARTVAERYFDDINSHDESDAEGLICEAAKTRWKQAIDAPGGDFTVHVDNAAFARSGDGSQPDSIDVTYNVDVSAGSQHKSNELTFTVIDEGGAKICGEA
jgi:hypothetical protein